MLQLLVNLLFEGVALKATEDELCEFVCPLRFIFGSGKVRSGEILRGELGEFAIQFDWFSFSVLHGLFPFCNEKAPEGQGLWIRIVYFDYCASTLCGDLLQCGDSRWLPLRFCLLPTFQDVRECMQFNRVSGVG
jgi:hypothetical protein